MACHRSLFGATASSGLVVTFSVSSGPCTVSGSALTVTGAGTCVVAANQAGNVDYTASATVSHSIVVNAAMLTVTVNNASRAYGVANPTFTANYSGFVNGDTSSVLSGTPSLTTAATTYIRPWQLPDHGCRWNAGGEQLHFQFCKRDPDRDCGHSDDHFYGSCKPGDLWGFADLFECHGQFWPGGDLQCVFRSLHGLR